MSGHDEEPERVPLHRALNRDNLFMGGDRELVMFSGLIAGTLVFYSMEIKAAIAGVLFWLFAIFVLRLMAKHDPKMRWVYMRHRIYLSYYPCKSTPFRNNPESQARQYKDPWKT